MREQIQSIERRQQEAARNPADWGKLREELLERIEDLESENRNILEQLREVESENLQFASRYVEIEEENNNLANLYVASFQLHSTLDSDEVLRIIVEIVINLIGAELFYVSLVDQKTGVMEPVAAEGIEHTRCPSARVGEGPVGEAVLNGDVRYGEADRLGPITEGGEPLVCIPLSLDEKRIGAIVIHELLQQKEGFSALDEELFRLLAGHAATAIFASELYSQSERKLNTIRGFVDLLTN